MDDTCIHCGFCCRRCSCPFGEWDNEKKQCSYLKKLPTELDQYICEKYEVINSDPSSVISPAFGTGCCSNLNEDRRAILKKINQQHPLRNEFKAYFKKAYDNSDNVGKYILDAREEDLFVSFLKKREYDGRKEDKTI